MKKIIGDMKYHIHMVKSHGAAAMELRGAFLALVFGMVINNSSFVFIWMLFFAAFGSVNQWNMFDVILLQAYIAITFGLGRWMWGGIFELPTMIHRGEFDRLLLSPRSLYVMISTRKSYTSAIGDVLFGVVLLIAYTVLVPLSILQIVAMMLLIIPATMIFVNVSFLYSIIAFYIEDADGVSRGLFEIFFGPAFYPSGLFEGLLRAFFFLFIPSLTIAGIPVEMVKNADYRGMLLVFALALGWWVLAEVTLRVSAKRYVGASA